MIPSSVTLQLLEACKFGNLALIKDAVSRGAHTTVFATSDEDSSPALHLCGYGHLECLKWLVENSTEKIDLTVREHEALRYAAESGFLEVVQWIIEESGQVVDATDALASAILEALNNDWLDVAFWILYQSPQASELQLNPMLTKTLAEYLEPGAKQLCLLTATNFAASKAALEDRLAEDADLPMLLQQLHAAQTQFSAIQQQIRVVQEAQAQQLEQLSETAKKHLHTYLGSEVCKKAAASGFVTTLAEAETLLQREALALSKDSKRRL